MYATMSALARFLTTLVAAPVDPLGLQGAEETLDHRVVPAVPLAAHTVLDAVGVEPLVADDAHHLIHVVALAPAQHAPAGEMRNTPQRDPDPPPSLA